MSMNRMNHEMILSVSNQIKSKNEKPILTLRKLTHINLKGQLKPKRIIKKIEGLECCVNLKVLNLYDNEITEIENLENSPEISFLNLQNNKISRIQNLCNQKKLKKLFLEKNRVSCLEGLDECKELEELYLSNQHLDKSTIFTFENLTMQSISSSIRILQLSNCRVSSINDLLHLAHLEELDLSKNNISKLEDAFMLVGDLKRLRNLDLQFNPVCCLTKYREKTIVFSQRTLEILDKKDIDSKQRLMMQSHAAHKYRKRVEKKKVEEPETNATGGKDNFGPVSKSKRGLTNNAPITFGVSGSTFARVNN